MKKLSLLLLILPISAFAQQIQWASKMLKSSSDLGGKQYSARRVLGKPDVFPQGGDSPNAWAPKDAQDDHDFIELEYENAQSVKQIAVFENLNAGCLVKIMVGKGDGKYKEVFRNKVDITYWKEKSKEFNRAYYFNKKRRKVVKTPEDNTNPGIEYAILDKSENNVKAIRVVFNFKKTNGQKQIDAIGISDSETPLIPTIKSNDELKKLNTAEDIFSSNHSFTISNLSGNLLYLSMDDDDGKTKIYTLTQHNNKWENLQLASPNLNQNPVYNYVPFVSRDQSVLIHGGKTYDKSKAETGFEFFKKQGNDYVFDKDLAIVAYSNFAESADLSMSEDRKMMILGIESDITQGALDLYFSKLKDDGTYSLVQNLGKNINSANEEVAPFLCDDGKTLFLASNGFSGYGDFDLYYTLRLDDTWKKWSEPTNLGPKINSNSAEISSFYDLQMQNLFYVAYFDEAYHLLKIKLPYQLLNNN